VSFIRILRPLLTGLLLIPFCAFWAQDQPVNRLFSLMVPPVAMTMVVAALNVLLRLRLPRLALTGGEILIVYVMLSVACAVCGEWMDMIVPQVYGYAIYADTNPRIADRILPFVSEWLFFKDPAQLKDFRSGGKGFDVFWSQLPMWLPKVGMWTLFLMLLTGTMGAVNTLLREQWTARERLSFPIVQIPLVLAEEGGPHSIWRSKLLWSAFTLLFTIDMVNGIAFLVPSIPSINIRYLGDVGAWATSPPWNQLGWIPIGLFPYIAALGAFVPSDLMFSLLFFFVVRKGQQVVAWWMGNEQGTFGGGGLVPSPPYFSEQSWGAFLGLFVTGMWMARPHWSRIVSALGGDRGVPGPEIREARAAITVLVLCLVGLVAFSNVVGIPPEWAAVYIVVYLLFSVALTRLRAQLGAPTHEMAFMGPHQLFLDANGTAGLPADTTTRTLTTFHLMNRIHRTHAMPTLLEGQYLVDRVGGNRLIGSVAMALAVLLGAFAGQLTHIWLGYRWTPVAWVSAEAAGAISQIQTTPRPPNPAALGAVGIGALVVWTLDFIRFRFPGFWLHPAGYALAMNFGVDYYWFGLTLVLITKVFLQRYWGLRGGRWLREAAIGVILGEFAAELIWAVFSMANDRQITYSISINGKMAWNQ